MNKEPEIFFETEAKIRSAIFIDNGRLYFGNENCEFYAVDIFTRKKLWKYSTDATVETWPLITNGKIIFNAENTLYILDCVNGNELHKVTHPSINSIRVSSDRYAFNDSYTAVSEGTAYFITLDGKLAAVDIDNGNIIWTLPSENQGTAASGVNFYDGRLYYVDSLGFMCCIKKKKRQTIFKTDLTDRIFAPMHINNGKIYVAGRSQKMYCIDGNNGEIIWSSFSYDKTTWFSGGSVSIRDTLYTCTSDEKAIVSFNKDTGELLRLYPTGANAYTLPVLNGENIVCAATDVYSFNLSFIMEYDTKTNEKLWQCQLADCVLSSPAIYQGVLYFGSDSGKIYSIKL
jgi:outer membrane protein assembly factor BamB